MKLAVLLALVGALFVSAPAARAADEESAVMATVNGFVDTTMAGKPVTQLFSSNHAIIDEFAPYRWIGANAVDIWLGDFGAMLQKEGVTEPLVRLGAPVRIEVTGERAYVVVPATYDFKLRGTAMHTSAATAFTLDKTSAGWKISAFSWAGPRAHP